MRLPVRLKTSVGVWRGFEASAGRFGTRNKVQTVPQHDGILFFTVWHSVAFIQSARVLHHRCYPISHLTVLEQ